jgi:hypothetical protein
MPIAARLSSRARRASKYRLLDFYTVAGIKHDRKIRLLHIISKIANGSAQLCKPKIFTNMNNIETCSLKEFTHSISVICRVCQRAHLHVG